MQLKDALLGTAIAAATLMPIAGRATDDAHDHSTSQAMHSAMDEGIQTMKSARMTGDPDVDFATMMKMHHEAGIKMAEAYLKDAEDPKIREMASEIISSQKKESKEFEDWLAAHRDASSSARE